MIGAIVLFCAAIPMIGYTALVWWLDRYEREPVGMVVLFFLYGAVMSPPLTIGLHVLLVLPLARWLPPAVLAEATTVVLAPLLEEIVKSAALLVFWKNRNFDNATDGIVYGSAIGFGFGMTENLVFFAGAQWQAGNVDVLPMILFRSIFSATLHALTTGLVGYFLGQVKFQKCKLLPKLIWGLLLAVLVHVFWNVLITLTEITDKPHFLTVLVCLFPVLLLGLFYLMQMSLLEESKVIRAELVEEAALGVLPANLVEILPYYHKRIGKGWIDDGIKLRYISTATALTFKKRRLRFSDERERTRLAEEVRQLRAQLLAYDLPGRNRMT